MRVRAAFLVTVIVLAGCGDDSDGTAAPSTTSVPPTISSAGPVDGPDGSVGDCPDRPAGSSAAVFDAAAGTYAVTISDVDPASATVSFDVVQWLSGDDATDAYQEEFPDDPDGPPNDYWVRNIDPTVREAPVAVSAEVLLVRLSADASADVDPATLAELPDYLNETPFTLFWLTFDAGTVVSICEQYTP